MIDIAHHLTLRTLSAWVDQLRLKAASFPPARPLNPRVLPINSVEAATPIFMIPQMMIFSDMAAALGTSQPVYALQMLDEDVPSAMDSASLEEIAVLYCNLIREVQPRGPYRLGGWCLWGLVAYEVARLLEKQGADVELLIIVDTWAPGHWDDHSPSRELFLAAAHGAYRLGRMARRFWLGTMEERKKDILSGLRSMRDPGPAAPNNFGPSHIERLVSSAAVAYRPEPVQGNVLIFRSELRSGGPLVRNDMGWARVLRRPVNVTTLPGNHREIFDPPGANIMAECIQEMLDFEQA
jgi:thioesterase domain-containing protein